MSDVQPATESRSTVTEPPCDTNRTDPLDVLGTAVLLCRQRFTITSRVTGSSRCVQAECHEPMGWK